MSNLTVRYYINLVSDIAKKSQENARALEMANKRQSSALAQTEAAATRADKAVSKVGSRSGISKLDTETRRGTSAVDNLASATQRADRALTRLGIGSSSFERMNRYMTNIARRMEDVKRHAAQVGGVIKGLDGVATGVIAGGATAAAMIKRPMDFDTMLADLANTAFADRDVIGRIKGISELETVINNAVRSGGGSRDTAASALNELIASGAVSAKDAMQMLPDLQKAATASGADVKELTFIAIRAMQNYGLKAQEIPLALSKAIKAGQAGGFELKDMSRWLPQMMSNSKGMLGMKGMEAFEKLLTMSQASVITAGTKDEAGNNLVNLIRKINSRDTAVDFARIGINLPKSLTKAMEDGVAAPDAFVDFVEQIAMKDKDFARLKKQADSEKGEKKQETLNAMADILQGSAIGSVIQDAQALSALIALMQNKNYVKDVEEQVRSETGRTAEDNFAVKKSRLGYQWQQTANESDIARSSVFNLIDSPLQAVLSSTTKLAKEFPLLSTGVAGAASAFAVIKAASIGSGITHLLRGGLSGASAASQAATTVANTAATGSRLNAFMMPETPATAPAATGILGRAGGILRKLGWLGVGLTAVDVGTTLVDDRKTAEEKVVKIGEAGGGLAGGWAGAKAGAALGSFAGPIGTLLGGLVGGGLGWWAGSKLVGNSLLQPPTAETAQPIQPQKVDVDIKQGRLAVDVTVTDDRAHVDTRVMHQFENIQIDAGSTNPAGR